MRQLSGKKVLFFCPKFFGYEAAIKEKMEALGAVVDYYDERPKNNFFTKAAIRLNKKLIKYKIESYYHEILKQTAKKEYDYVFVVNIEAMLPKVLRNLRQQQSCATFILYMWDSLRNKKYADLLLPFFDFVFSFDKKDSQNDAKVMFRPLFYIDTYSYMNTNGAPVAYDLSFIGTVHSDRYHLVSTVREQLKQAGKKVFFYLFFPSKKIFLYRRLSDPKFMKASAAEFNFKALSQNEILKIIRSSGAVLDIQHPSQVGLTMRTIEMLGAGKKIITTNSDIVNYDFYKPENILVIDRDLPKIDVTFWEKSFSPVDTDILFKYSLEGWLTEIFTRSITTAPN